MSGSDSGGAKVSVERDFAARDLAVALAALGSIVLWEIGGWDLPISRAFGAADGFALRDAWLTRTAIHGAGRMLAGLGVGLLLLDLVWPIARGPTRAARGYWLAVILAVMLAVPAIKRLSATSCPWELAEFGGAAAYVPHWLVGVADGGSGHCFPSGHAVSAFAFFGLYFLWRGHRPGFARVAASAVLALGVVYGLGQLARGAHFASHTMWSGWIAWSMCALAAALRARATARPRVVDAAMRRSA